MVTQLEMTTVKRLPMSSLMTLLMLFGSLVLVSGCTTSVVVEGTVPTPLVQKIPARLGVHYSEAFKNYHHQEEIEDLGTWSIDFGVQNLAFFRNLTQAMFFRVEEIDAPSPSAEEQLRLDGVLVPEITKFGFLVPEISGLKFYSVSIEYQLRMYNKQGAKIGEWTLVGYGKSEGGMFTADDALNEATALAIRDGGARIAIELATQPGIRAWMNTLEE